MKITWFGILILIIFSSCQDNDLEQVIYDPQPYEIKSDRLGEMLIPSDNPTTYDGVVLGQHLFYDPILSADGTMSCSSCHHPNKAFTDGLAMSEGIDGELGKLSSMSLINQGYNTNGLFWDGRSLNLEDQAIEPVENPIELHHSWKEIEKDLQEHPDYPTLFKKAFGIKKKKLITRDLAAKALAQFQRAIISDNSLFDRVEAGIDVFTDEELLGYQLYYDLDPLIPDGTCFHCHGGKLTTSNEYLNNGLQVYDENTGYPNKARQEVTGQSIDEGKFRVPTLRNITLTAPYMHDGRFETLEEVVEHYDSGGHKGPNVDGNIVNIKMTQEQKDAIVAFLHTLTDTSYLDNPLITNPFE